MNSKPIQTGVVEVAVVGLDIQFNVREGLLGGELDLKVLERLLVLAVGIFSKPHWIAVFLRVQPEDLKLSGSAVDLPTGRHGPGDVLHGEPAGHHGV